MSSLSTFGAFTTARLGIYASQKALDVVGNNISNINTKGYTRQTLDQVSLFTGHADRYTNGLDIRVGNGPLVTAVTQLRDPYLDIRYRNETSTVGALDAKLGGLEQISHILDEVAKGEDIDGELGVVEKQLNDLIKQVQRYNTEGAGLDDYDTNVRTSAGSLTKLLNSYANRLAELHKTQETALAEDVDKVNNILTTIRDLNSSIRKSSIYGGDCLEQRDLRNNLIDELSGYMRIDVSYEIEKLGGGLEVEKLVIRLQGNDSKNLDKPGINNATLIDGVYGAQISINDHPVTRPKVDADGNPVYETEMVDDGTGTLVEQVKKDEDDNPIQKIEYLGIDGKPVENEADAAREYDSDYAITVSELVDRFNRLDVLATKKTLSDPYATKADAEAAMAGLPTTGPGERDGQTVNYKYAVVEQKDAGGNKTYAVQTTAETVSASVELTDNTLYGSLQSQRELLTEQGEYATRDQLAVDSNANIKRGIPYYQKALDTLANQFAHMLNEANRLDAVTAEDLQKKLDAGEPVYVDDVFEDENGNHFTLATCTGEDGKLYFTPADGVTTTPDETWYEVPKDGKLTEKQLQELLPANYKLKGADGAEAACRGKGKLEPVSPSDGALFSNSGNSDDTTGITAANISISKSWGEGVVRIQHSKNPHAPSTDNTNLNHILHILQNEEIDFRPMGDDLEGKGNYEHEADRPASNNVFFSGTFQQMFTEHMCGTLAADKNSTATLLDNHATSQDELYVDRDAVSGVDLNDEAMNMMQFQKSLNAAYRFMTVIDETLDKLINGTGVAGR